MRKYINQKQYKYVTGIFKHKNGNGDERIEILNDNFDVITNEII